jgi:hypothetical protein
VCGIVSTAAVSDQKGPTLTGKRARDKVGQDATHRFY